MLIEDLKNIIDNCDPKATVLIGGAACKFVVKNTGYQIADKGYLLLDDSETERQIVGDQVVYSEFEKDEK